MINERVKGVTFGKNQCEEVGIMRERDAQFVYEEEFNVGSANLFIWLR